MLLRGDSISISSPQSDTGRWLSSERKGLRGFPPSGGSWRGAGEGRCTFGLGVRCSLGLPACVRCGQGAGGAAASPLLPDSFSLSLFSPSLELWSNSLPSSSTSSSSSLASSHSSSSSSSQSLLFSSACEIQGKMFYLNKSIHHDCTIRAPPLGKRQTL